MYFKDYLLALVTAVLWGGNFIATKYGIDGFGVFGLSLIRVTLVSILFFPYLKFEKQSFKQIIKIALVHGVGFIIFINISIKYTDNFPLIIILVQTVTPIGAILSYFYFKEKIALHDFVGMCIAFVGVIILVGVPKNFISLFSIIAVLISAFSQAWQMVLIKKYAKEMDTKNLLGWIHLLNIPFFFLLFLVFEDFSLDFMKERNAYNWIGALYVGVASAAIGFGIWLNLLKKYSVNKVAPFMLFVPFFGILFSVLFFDSKLTQNVIIGGTLIIVGVSIIQFWSYIKSKNKLTQPL